MKESIQELAATETLDIRGTSGTFYTGQPVKFLTEVMDAAKKQFFFANFVNVEVLPTGTRQISIPKRTMYDGDSGTTWNTTGSDSGGSGAGVGPYANTIADISWTSQDNHAGVVIEPIPHLSGQAIRRYDIRSNALNLVKWAKDELANAIGDRIDITLAKLFGTGDGLTYAETGVRGAIVLYGGDATGTDSLAVGDVLTTDLVASAARYLKGKQNYTRDATDGKSGTWAYDATIEKNPWQNTPDDPYVLFIGVAQEEALRKDSQFVNAAEYGSDTVVQNGEIGQYLGIRIVVTVNVETTAAGDTSPDDTTAAVQTTRCILAKMKKAATLVWGQQPSIEVFEYKSQDQIRIGMYSAYAMDIVHSDAVVTIDVSDA